MSKLLIGSLLESNIIYIPTKLTQYILCSKEENLDPSLLDEEDTPMTTDGLNEDIHLEDYLDDANDAFESQAGKRDLVLAPL